jgi:hypothetical protein
MLLNADFLRLKMKGQKVVLTNGGSIDSEIAKIETGMKLMLGLK